MLYRAHVGKINGDEIYQAAMAPIVEKTDFDKIKKKTGDVK